MTLILSNAIKGMPTSKILSQMVFENKSITAIFVFAYRHPRQLQQRITLTIDEHAIIEKATALRGASGLPFWDALMLSCFGEKRDFKRLLKEATFHQSHADSLLRLTREEILADRLDELMAEQSSDSNISFSSRIEWIGQEEKHLPLLDFHCPDGAENDGLVSAVSNELFYGTKLIFSSGESYHALGLDVLNERGLRDFLTRSLLFAPIVDARYVTHQLIEGACALRLSNSLNKPNRPRLKFILR